MTLTAKETAIAAMAGKQPSLVPAAIADAFRKLNPRELASNPVMFVTELSAIAVPQILTLTE